MALDWLCRVWGYDQGLGVFVVQGLGFRGLRGPGCSCWRLRSGSSATLAARLLVLRVLSGSDKFA